MRAMSFEQGPSQREGDIEWIVADWHRQEFWGGSRVGFTHDREQAKRFRSTRAVARSIGQIRRRFRRRTIDYYRADAPLPGEGEPREQPAEAVSTAAEESPGDGNVHAEAQEMEGGTTDRGEGEGLADGLEGAAEETVSEGEDRAEAPAEAQEESALSGFAHADLRAELDRRRDALEEKKAGIEQELAWIDGELAELTQAVEELPG